jgi:hypothetical protein
MKTVYLRCYERRRPRLPEENAEIQAKNALSTTYRDEREQKNYANTLGSENA